MLVSHALAGGLVLGFLLVSLLSQWPRLAVLWCLLLLNVAYRHYRISRLTPTPLPPQLENLRNQTLLMKKGGLTFSAMSFGSSARSHAIILLHGFPDNPTSFRYQIPALVKAGYRVIVPTMRGYEPSSQSQTGSDNDYSLTELSSDIIAWGERLRESGVKTLHILGHDWGSSTACVGVYRRPDLFSSLILLSVPHTGNFARFGILLQPLQVFMSWYAILFYSFRAMETVFTWGNFTMMSLLWKSWSPNFSLTPTEWKSLVETFSQPGVTSAALAYYRANFSPLNGFLPQQFSPILLPTLSIAGREDGAIHSSLHEPLHSDYGTFSQTIVENVLVEDAGHFVHIEKPVQVNEFILQWLCKRDGKL
eukprot:TRINITY_DN5903_c0_g1_i1.p1 TRINITY_DN5903_c0_g1~~TRINITY_DN5903_c0_g1_i1.p1  ORF type:complete len:364 (-),score=34.91 TRINITY_DN5903_c0_g1_i1:76-1167(-)